MIDGALPENTIGLFQTLQPGQAVAPLSRPNGITGAFTLALRGAAMNRPWMPLYVADYRADTAHLSAAQHGAYLLLIMHYWSTGSLPDDDAALARVACMTAGEWRKSRPIVAAFFHDGWHHKRVDAELAKAADISSKRAASAKQKHSKSSANAEQLDTHARASPPSPSQREDAAVAAPVDLERQLFERGKAVAGKDAGGLIAKLLKAKKGDVALARAAIEQASTKQNPREYIGAVIAGGHASADGKRLTNDEAYWGVGRIPGII